MNDGFTKVIIFIVQLLIGLPVAFYIFSGCRASEKQLSKELLKDENYEKDLRSVRFLSPVAGVFSALPVCVLYVIFFFSQLSYFLSAFMDKLPSNDTIYSEYARRGFFELCFVSVINLAIILALNLFCKDNDKEEPAVKAIYGGEIKPGDVVVIRYEGPKGGLPVGMTNDANAAALGEMTYGVARGMKNWKNFATPCAISTVR